MKKRLPIIIIAVLVVVFAGLGFYSIRKVRSNTTQAMSTEILPETFTMPACFVRKTEPFILPIRMTITGCIPWIQTAII